ncbi:MAG: cyclomaltodextrinase C-terminal domain-containing protein [Ignavibacteriaceae bacterium]|nr:cyclomaltodextrinase C-terminal domain-containing protein [Ignavibacteriaceae bacterium]
MKISLALLLINLSLNIFAQTIVVDKIEPPNWWSNMKYNEVQFMLYGKNLNNLTVINDLSELKVKKIHNADAAEYCFLDVEIPAIELTTNYKIYLTNKIDTLKVEIPVFKREKCAECFKGFNSKDIIYLITPDRFCNGDLSNDLNPNYFPDFPFKSEMGRHGGDIQGIINNLDYIEDIGFTAIWINPLLENNGKMSYHGYAATDLYKIDERFGTNELYKKLVAAAHKKGIKIIFDHINNHIGINHPWITNSPFIDWFNGTKSDHFVTPHEKISIFSSYSSTHTIDSTIKGWFVESMPDLNQQNPYVAKYLIQNMIWWIEYTGLDGIREDTYPYSDQEFLAEWNRTILEEYPNLNITGEVWIEDPALLAPYQKNSKLNSTLNTNLPSLIDFGLYRAFKNFVQPNGRLNDLYEALAKDFLYSDPNNHLTFVDNHDIERIMYSADENIAKFKQALTILFTTRGIPQIYYGTEIGMVGGKSHGELREEFPGGFPDHSRNAFVKEGRTQKENDLVQFMKNLISLRKKHSALQTGKLMHFPPKENIYIYFRVDENEKFMIIINNNNYHVQININAYASIVGTIRHAIDLSDNKELDISANSFINIDSNSSRIILLK